MVSRIANGQHVPEAIGGGKEVERITNAWDDYVGPGSGVRNEADGQSLGGLNRATQHVNNFPGHLVCMVHTAPGQGRVICVTPHSDSTDEWDEKGCYVIDEWDNTEQIRKDFE
jgi:hypothetical protein